MGREMRPDNTVVFDFDGVIHGYQSGWKGADVIPDGPVKNIKEAIDIVRKAGLVACVVSARCAQKGGQQVMAKWLDKYGITVDYIRADKPPAILYIDDRALCFNPEMIAHDPGRLLKIIQAFRPWHGKG